mgnify:CR=1 FL=1
MNIVEIIEKKKNKEELTFNEIKYAVEGYIIGIVKDYQMSALLMAIVLNGMSEDETFNLTKIMLDSGDKIDLSNINGIKVDKHSTGGIGDKTSLVVLPLVASCGVPVAKMSGRGLGFTGGTIDKLESIEGFKTSMDEEDFIKQVNKINIALISQTGNLVPADKKIYALRDVTGTTESIPLIASSIMSKKLASGSDKIVLDVKVGKGAFMKNLSDARKLAELMVKIGNNSGKETVALLTNMDYPLGRTIGNGLEVQEAIDTLLGNGDSRFLNLCLVLASYMVSLGKNISLEKALEEVEESYKNKKGYEKLKEFVSAQGGNIDNIEISSSKIEIISDKEGYITNIDSLHLAELSNSLGAGRTKKEDSIDHGVGIKLEKVYGDKVNKGDILCYVYTNKSIDEKEYRDCFNIEDDILDDIKVIYDVIK